MVASPTPFDTNPMVEMKTIDAEWVALVPYGFTRRGEAGVVFNHPSQWWGETYEGISECIDLAKENGFKVMLKPQVYIPGSWVGDMDFTSEEEWLKWEKEYESYVFGLVEIAANKNIEMFCIGTEYKIAIKKREKFWRQLIEKTRSVFKGKIVYSSNWDNYNQVPFWDVLDVIGISAYFPLVDDKTPKVKDLKKEWKSIGKELKKFSRRNNKPILFTEFGYLSVDGCAYRAWELEKRVRQTPINEQAQSNAYQALLEFFAEEDYWMGGFLWKWFPNMKGHEGYPNRDYTPQGKIAKETIRTIYNKMNISNDHQENK